MTNIKTANAETIQEAAKLIKSGRLVAFPTETVYGLGANALDGAAVAQIFEAKGRPSFNPLISHIADIKDVEALAEMNDQARTIAEHFWPGPLTLILPRKKDCPVSELVTAGLKTIAIRMPAHKTARSLIKTAGTPICAPSANKSGTLSPTAPAHVAESLGGAIDLIVADGSCEIGLESTVVDLTGNAPIIVRPGSITAEDLFNALEQDITYDLDPTEKPKSPGQLLKHYAPNTPVRLNAIDLEPGEALLAFGSIKFMGLKGGGAAQNLPDTAIRNLSENQDLHEAASNLFRMMRELDRPEHKAIAVMQIPDQGLGIAINDRLKRAASN